MTFGLRQGGLAALMVLVAGCATDEPLQRTSAPPPARYRLVTPAHAEPAPPERVAVAESVAGSVAGSESDSESVAEAPVAAPGPDLPEAERRFVAMEPKLTAFGMRQLRGSADEQQATIARLMTELDALVTGYGQVLDVADPHWACAALYRIGQSYETMAAIVRDGRLPPEAQAHQPSRQAYHDSIEQLAWRFVDKARQIYLQQQDLADAEGVRSTWTERAAAALWQLQ